MGDPVAKLKRQDEPHGLAAFDRLNWNKQTNKQNTLCKIIIQFSFFIFYVIILYAIICNTETFQHEKQHQVLKFKLAYTPLYAEVVDSGFLVWKISMWPRWLRPAFFSLLHPCWDSWDVLIIFLPETPVPRWPLMRRVYHHVTSVQSCDVCTQMRSRDWDEVRFGEMRWGLT